MTVRANRNVEGGLIGGCIVVVVGVLFLLDNLGLISIGHLFRFWPMILVVGGIASLMTRQGRIKGAILIVAGILLELNALDIAHFRWSSLWPLAIIAAGLMVMWSTLEGRRLSAQNGDRRNYLNEFALFGGSQIRVTSQDFRGGNVTAIFGGFEIDLRHAAIGEEEAELTINAMFGGCEVLVPNTWEIIIHGQGIFGGYGDSSKPNNAPPEVVSGTPRKVLLLRGVAMFGGVEIKS
jgi:predicted membrane protein